MKYYLPGIICFWLLASCNNAGDKVEAKIVLSSVEEFKKLSADQNIMILDVRTAEEYQNGFIKGAVNIDIKLADFEKRMNHFDKKVPIAIYCAKGIRSAKAATKLKELGFEQIYDLKGGYNAWKERVLE